jgi:hypothetical protein
MNITLGSASFLLAGGRASTARLLGALILLGENFLLQSQS